MRLMSYPLVGSSATSPRTAQVTAVGFIPRYDISVSYMLSSHALKPLNHHRHALAAADAHRLEPDRASGRLQVVQQRAHDPRARHAVRMPERDRAAVGVQLLRE